MDLYDWLLFLHLLGAFAGASALVALWAVVFATRPGSSLLAPADGMKIGNIAGPIVGVGMGVALIFGVWLAFQVEGYHVWDGWILGAIVLWVVGAASGAKSGKLFVADAVGNRSTAVRLQIVSTAAIIAILVLMIWKPGA